MTLRNPRRETESTHSEAPLGNSRCRACFEFFGAGEFFERAPVFGAGFFAPSCAMAASMRSRTVARSSVFEGQTSSRFLIWIRPAVFFSSFVMRVNRCAPRGSLPP